jgi:hypothetical protein
MCQEVNSRAFERRCLHSRVRPSTWPWWSISQLVPTQLSLCRGSELTPLELKGGRSLCWNIRWEEMTGSFVNRENELIPREAYHLTQPFISPGVSLSQGHVWAQTCDNAVETLVCLASSRCSLSLTRLSVWRILENILLLLQMARAEWMWTYLL